MPTLDSFPYSFLVLVAVSFGLLFGSFLNVVIYRLPRGESLAVPGSRCPFCATPIRAWNNVPVLSWALLRGRAPCCRARISLRYPLVELLGAAFAWAILNVVVLGMPPSTPWWHSAAVFFLYLGMALGLLAASWIDFEHMILPDPITIGGTLLGLATAPLRPHVGLMDGLLGASIGFAMIWLPFIVLYGLVRGHPGMGLGDAKLTMLAGAWFGWPGAVFALCVGAVQGTLLTLIVLLVRGRIDEPEAVKRERAALRAELEAADPEERARIESIVAGDPLAAEPGEGLGQVRIPFGPFLALAIVEYLLVGEPFVKAYLAWTAW